MFSHILFDLDGTLTDPGTGIITSVVYALSRFGIGVTPEERASLGCFIGPPLLDSFASHYGLKGEEGKKAVAYYREYFSVKGLYENEVYDGIPAVLETLKGKGKILGVATSKPEPFAIEILRHFDLEQYFDFIAGALMDETRTRKDEVIDYAIRTYSLPKESTVMVGDRSYDIEGAKVCGLRAVGVLYGYGSADELTSASPFAVASSPAGLLSLLLS